MKKSIVSLMILLVALVVVFAGCGAPANSVNGLWYDESGVTGTLEFKGGGVVSASIMGITLDGKYTFDAATGKGTITMMDTDSEFELKDGKLSLDGSTYTRDKVEQQDLGDVMEGLGDSLTVPSN